MAAKKVYAHESLVHVTHLANVLTSQGIPVELRNTRLASITGEVPFLETWPEIWVRNPLDVPRAMELIEEVESGPVETGGQWECSECGELVDDVFAVCWRCGHARDGNPDA